MVDIPGSTEVPPREVVATAEAELAAKQAQEVPVGLHEGRGDSKLPLDLMASSPGGSSASSLGCVAFRVPRAIMGQMLSSALTDLLTGSSLTPACSGTSLHTGNGASR